MNARVPIRAYPSPRPLLLLVADSSAPDQTPDEPQDVEPETVSDWSVVHKRIVALGKQRAAHERELCRWLAAAERLGVPARNGFANLHEYARAFAGLESRDARDRLRVGRALGVLPGFDEAFAKAKLTWSAVRELTHVATPENEETWLRWVEGKTSRDIERAVSGRRSGDGPTDPPDPSLVRHRLSFEVRAETMALFRDLQAAIRRDLGGQADDDAVLYEVTRRALGGPTDEGRASYQVAVVTCDACRSTSIDAGGETHVVDPAVAEMMACDSQSIGRVDGSAPTPATHVGCDAAPMHGEPAPVTHVGRDAGPMHGEPAPATHVGRDASLKDGDPTPVTHVGCDTPSATHTDAKAKPTTPRKETPARASQTIPPAIRRLVLRRDRGRCTVPGCSNHVFLDLHHADPRCEGGTHDPERIVSLCGSHHRAAHLGSLVVDGTASSGFTFRHADGTPYGQPFDPRAVDVAKEVLGMLVHLGFKPTRARALVDAVQRAGAPPDVAAFLHAALRAS